MKLFASDYDGTYLKHTKRGQLDLKRNIKMTKKWQEAGHLFVFATGRPIWMMQLEKKMHGIVYDYIIGLNGAIIVSKQGEILFQQAMNQKIAKKILKLIQEQDFLQYSITDGIRGYYHGRFSLRNKSFYLLMLFKLFFKKYSCSLEKALSQEIVQIAVETRNHDEAVRFAKQINDEFGGDVIAFANLHHVDIAAKGLSKGTGVAYVANRHSIQQNEVYCMGDSFNDLPMLETYHGITMPEARQEIKDKVEGIYDTVGGAMVSLLKDR